MNIVVNAIIRLIRINTDRLEKGIITPKQYSRFKEELTVKIDILYTYKRITIEDYQMLLSMFSDVENKEEKKPAGSEE